MAGGQVEAGGGSAARPLRCIEAPGAGQWRCSWIHGRVWLPEKFFAHVFREENLVRMEYQMKSICKTFSWMSVIFRDESSCDN